MIGTLRRDLSFLLLTAMLMVLASWSPVFADGAGMADPGQINYELTIPPGGNAGESGSLKAEVDRLTAENNELRDKLDRLSDANELDDQLDSAMALITAYEEMIAELQERIADLEAELVSPSPEVEELQMRVDALTKENEDLRSKLGGAERNE